MHRRDVSKGLLASAVGVLFLTHKSQGQETGPLGPVANFPPTNAERDARVTIVAASYFPGDVRRYGAVGDDVTNDRSAILSAIAQFERDGGAPIAFEQGRSYFLGDYASGATILRISSVTGKEIHGNGARLRINTIDNSAPVILQLVDCRQVAIHHLRAIDSGAVVSRPAGAILFDIMATGPTDEDIGHISLYDCELEGGAVFLRVRGDQSGQVSTNQVNRIRDVRVVGGRAKRVFYGINCQNHGDGVRVEMQMEGVARAYFVYGVADHRFDVHVDEPDGGYAQCLIKAYDRSTENIHGKLYLGPSIHRYECLTLEFQNDVQTQWIRDIDIEVNCRNTSATPVTFRAFDTAGNIRRVTTNRWDNLRLGGDWNDSPTPIVFASRPAVAGSLSLSPTLNIPTPSMTQSATAGAQTQQPQQPQQPQPSEPPRRLSRGWWDLLRRR